MIKKGLLRFHGLPEDLLRPWKAKVWEMVIPSADLAGAKQRFVLSGTVRTSEGVRIRVVGDERPGHEARVSRPHTGGRVLVSARRAPERERLMGAVGTLYQLAVADFLERTRRYSFLITLLGTLFFGFLVITGKWTLSLGEYRGEYNSAWVGSLMGSASTCMLGLFGFYLVKNSLSRDRRTSVGEILAATPLSGRLYIASKFVSNLAVLTSMTATLAVAAVVMQLLSPVEAGFDLWALVAPFLFVCLPVMALVAAAAVLFESIRPLRGTMGNILYLLIAEAALVNSLLLDVPLLDFSGLGLFIPSMEAAALAAYPDAELGVEMGFVGVAPGASDATMKLFHWRGIEWSFGMVPLRLLWIGAAVGLAALATLFFDRFDPARRERAKKGERRTTADGCG